MTTEPDKIYITDDRPIYGNVQEMDRLAWYTAPGADSVRELGVYKTSRGYFLIVYHHRLHNGRINDREGYLEASLDAVPAILKQLYVEKDFGLKMYRELLLQLPAQGEYGY